MPKTRDEFIGRVRTLSRFHLEDAEELRDLRNRPVFKSTLGPASMGTPQAVAHTDYNTSILGVDPYGAPSVGSIFFSFLNNAQYYHLP